MATAGDVLRRVRKTLIDAEGVRWQDAELMDHLNDGLSETVRLMPRSFSASEPVKLEVGTLQSLPDRGITFIDVVRNTTAEGAGGRAVRMVDRGILDIENPDWHLMDPVSTIKHCMFDERNPQEFYVYPPSDGTGYVQLVMSVEPPVLEDEDDELPLESTYLPALVNYVLSRAYAKDADYASNANLASQYYQTYTAQLGLYKEGSREVTAGRRRQSVTESANYGPME